MQDKLRAGIEAARSGDKTTAQRLLRQVTEAEPNNEIGWMWLASTLDNLQERRTCLERVLRINPGNARAREALDRLDAVLPSRAGQARRAPAAPREGAGGGLGLGVIAIGAVAIVALIVFVIISANAPLPPSEDVAQATFNALLITDTSTPTIDPTLFTPTPFFGIIVDAPTNNPTLPPTFTATASPTPTATLEPSPTPIPLSAFELLYTSLTAGEAQPALYRSGGDGSGEQLIGASSAGFSDVAFSPDGQRIAFSRVTTYTRDGAEVTAPELFIAPLNDLNAARQVTQLGAAFTGQPTWAPDNIQIVFVSDTDGDSELWYITEDGNNLRQLTRNNAIDRDPAWSPDGDLILYASDAGGQPGSGLTEIFSITPDAVTITQLTDDAGSSYSPAWSPDGERVVFVSDRSGDADIFTMEPGGQGVFRLTVDDGTAEDRLPIFRPDGRAVVFVSNREEDTFHLFEVDLEGRQVLRLADSGRDIQSMAFQPIPLFNLG